MTVRGSCLSHERDNGTSGNCNTFRLTVEHVAVAKRFGMDKMENEDRIEALTQVLHSYPDETIDAVTDYCTLTRNLTTF